MDQKPIKIKLYEDAQGQSDLLKDMSTRDQARFIKKNEDFEKLSFHQFLKSKLVDRIFNHNNFYELKYFFSEPPYRALAFIFKGELIILLVFKGSGSRGKLIRYLPRAINRANDWGQRY